MLKVFADRGGTFTDLVAVTNNQAIAIYLIAEIVVVKWNAQQQKWKWTIE